MPAVALFAATALALGLTAGFGLGAWLLLARTLGVTTLGASWLALVQVHGLVQLLGFAGLFVMGVGLHVLPKLRGAPVPDRGLVSIAYVGVVAGLVLRALAQPIADFPAREVALQASSILLVTGTVAFAVAAITTLLEGRNPHRADELVIGAGMFALPMATLLVVAPFLGAAPLLVAQPVQDRAIWALLLGSFATTIFGVWARLAPAFVAAAEARGGRLVIAVVFWLEGVAALAAGSPIGPWILLAALILVAASLGMISPPVAVRPLAGHARLTLIAVRSAFAWAFAGVAILAAQSADLLGTSDFLAVSAARHALALGFVTLMLYGVAARALPAFLGTQLWSQRLQAWTLGLANAGLGLRVVTQLSGSTDSVVLAVEGLSGLIAYAALAAFTLNVVRTMRGRSRRPTEAGTPIQITPVRRRGAGA